MWQTGDHHEKVPVPEKKEETVSGPADGALLSDALEPGGSRNLVYDSQWAVPDGLLRCGRKFSGDMDV